MLNIEIDLLIDRQWSQKEEIEPVGKLAIEWLKQAAMQLEILEIPEDISEALLEALPFPWSDLSYDKNTLVPGKIPLEFSFTETNPFDLRIDFEPCGPSCSPATRRKLATDMVCQWADVNFAPETVREFKRSLNFLCKQQLECQSSFGAFIGVTLDRKGLAESKIYYELSDKLPVGLPPNLAAVAQAAVSSVPSLKPHFISIACTQSRCTPRLYFLCREEVTLVELRHVMAVAGLEHRLPEMASLISILSGEFLLLPAGGAVLSFREDHGVIDCKIELLAMTLPIPREALIRHLQLLVSERPGTRANLHRWSRALGEGTLLPGDLNVVGFRASTHLPAQLSLYVSPTRRSVPCPL